MKALATFLTGFLILITNIDTSAQTASDIENPPGIADNAIYFPAPESQGGWRMLGSPEDVRNIGGMDPEPASVFTRLGTSRPA